MSESFVKLFDSYWKYASPLAILAMAYLQTQFISKTEYQASADKVLNRIERIEQILIRMEVQQNILSDHEGRIRTLERK